MALESQDLGVTIFWAGPTLFFSCVSVSCCFRHADTFIRVCLFLHVVNVFLRLVQDSEFDNVQSALPPGHHRTESGRVWYDVPEIQLPSGGVLLSTHPGAFGTYQVRSIVFLYDQVWVAGPGSLAIFNPKTLRCIQKLKFRNPEDRITCLARTQERNSFLVWAGHKSGRVSVWDAKTKRLTYEIRRAHKASISVMAQVKNRLWTGSVDSNLRMWEIRTRKPIDEMPDHATSIRSILYVPETDTVWTGSDDLVIRLYNTETGYVQHTISGFNQGMCGMVYTQGCVWITGVRGSLFVFSATETVCVKEIRAFPGPTSCLHATEEEVWALGENKVMKVFNVEYQRTVKNILPTQSEVCITSLVPITNGRVFATCSDGKVRIWTALGALLDMHEITSRVKGTAQLNVPNGGAQDAFLSPIGMGEPDPFESQTPPGIVPLPTPQQQQQQQREQDSHSTYAASSTPPTSTPTSARSTPNRRRRRKHRRGHGSWSSSSLSRSEEEDASSVTPVRQPISHPSTPSSSSSSSSSSSRGSDRSQRTRGGGGGGGRRRGRSSGSPSSSSDSSSSFSQTPNSPSRHPNPNGPTSSSSPSPSRRRQPNRRVRPRPHHDEDQTRTRTPTTTTPATPMIEIRVRPNGSSSSAPPTKRSRLSQSGDIPSPSSRRRRRTGQNSPARSNRSRSGRETTEENGNRRAERRGSGRGRGRGSGRGSGGRERRLSADDRRMDRPAVETILEGEEPVSKLTITTSSSTTTSDDSRRARLAAKLETRLLGLESQQKQFVRRIGDSLGLDPSSPITIERLVHEIKKSTSQNQNFRRDVEESRDGLAQHIKSLQLVQRQFVALQHEVRAKEKVIERLKAAVGDGDEQTEDQLGTLLGSMKEMTDEVRDLRDELLQLRGDYSQLQQDHESVLSDVSLVGRNVGVAPPEDSGLSTTEQIKYMLREIQNCVLRNHNSTTNVAIHKMLVELRDYVAEE